MTDAMTESELPQGSPDKLYEHHRQQLSAMLDGALSPDAARFMLRRLQHDTELASCWERWQVCGDVLRGQRNALLPADFAQCVARAIAGDNAAPAATTMAAKPRWARWGGGAALAASVAVAALFVVRQTPSAVDPVTVDPATQIVAASAPAAASGGEIQTPAPAAPAPSPQPVAPDTAAQFAATAVAVADVPRRAAARRSRGQSQRAALRTPARSEAPAVAAVASTPVLVPAIGNASATADVDPFGAQALTAPSRPWPRAILPNFPAAGALTVDYGNGASTFYPFEPRLAVPADDSASGQQDSTGEPAPPQP